MENILKTELFQDDNNEIPLPEFCPNSNPNGPVIVAFSNFSGEVRDGIHLMRFRNVEGALV